MNFTPQLMRRSGAAFTAAVGMVNILSALYPAIPGRMTVLRELLPLHLIRSAQTGTLLTGFCLIILADGLRKRRRVALHVAITLLLVSSVLNVTKGLDFEESVLGLAAALILFRVRKSFDVSSALAAPRPLARRMSAFALLYFLYILLGFFVLRRGISPAPTPGGALAEPFRLLLDAPFYHYVSGQARWFERSLAFVASALAVYGLWAVLQPLLPRKTASTSDLERARALLRKYGSDSLSYFSLQHGRSYFFEESGEAFLSYRLWRNVAIVGGDIVGNPECAPRLIASFLDFADACGMEPCFLGIAGAHVGAYHDLGLRTIKIGEEAIIDLDTFDESALKRKVRRAARHCRDLGIRIETYSRAEIPDGILQQMDEINREWLIARGGKERGFSMTLGRLPEATDADCSVAVALEGAFVWGYLCLVPIYGRGGWSLDAMRRRSDAPNGLMEHLILSAAAHFQALGAPQISLNFATLANGQNDIESRALEGTRRFLYEHLSSFYQLQSLQQFNSKFQPRWQSRYLAYRDVLKIPKLAVAIAQSEDPIRLPSLPGLLKR